MAWSSPALLLLFLFLLTRTAPSAAQADGKFWWLRPSAQQDGSVLPGTIPNSEASVVEDARTPPAPAAAVAPESDQSCVCVDYYLCGADGYIITTGEGIVDVRSGLVGPPCGGIQVCCMPPRTNTGNSRITTTTTTSSTMTPPLYPPEECGIRGGDVISNLVDLRIVDTDSGNRSTRFAEFPWMLALLRSPGQTSASSQQQNNMFVCGASLVHPQVAMTAAHCVSRRNASELKVRAGEWDTQQSTELLSHQDRRVERIAVHPGFYDGTLYNDVALLFLESAFELAANVRTICLPQQGDVRAGGRCIATGWGRNAFGRNGTYQMTLRKVDLPVVEHDSCEDQLRNTRLSAYFNLHESFMCAGGERGKDTCQGDGGGPLFCRSARDNTHYFQLGITSWGIGCGDTDVPAVYANVPYFVNWVTSQLPGAYAVTSFP